MIRAQADNVAVVDGAGSNSDIDSHVTDPHLFDPSLIDPQLTSDTPNSINAVAPHNGSSSNTTTARAQMRRGRTKNKMWGPNGRPKLSMTEIRKRYDAGHGYTVYCGVQSPEREPPVAAIGRAGLFHCPRCLSRYTREDAVRDHWPGCIEQYGNPDSLRWTDHDSLQAAAAKLANGKSWPSARH